MSAGVVVEGEKGREKTRWPRSRSRKVALPTFFYLRRTPSSARPSLIFPAPHASSLLLRTLRTSCAPTHPHHTGSLRGMVRQLSIDCFENESRRVSLGPESVSKPAVGSPMFERAGTEPTVAKVREEGGESAFFAELGFVFMVVRRSIYAPRAQLPALSFHFSARRPHSHIPLHPSPHAHTQSLSCGSCSTPGRGSRLRTGPSFSTQNRSTSCAMKPNASSATRPQSCSCKVRDWTGGEGAHGRARGLFVFEKCGVLFSACGVIVASSSNRPRLSPHAPV